MSTTPESKPAGANSIDEEDDLFNFDELSEPAIATEATPTAAQSAVKPLDVHTEDAMFAVLGPAPLPMSASSASNAKHAPVGAPTVVPVQAAKPSSVAPSTSVAPPAQTANVSMVATSKLSATTIAVLAGVALVNLMIVGLVWKSMSTIQTSVERIQTHVAEATDRLPIPDVKRAELPHAPTIPSALQAEPEGDETLERARLAMDRGDFEGARRTLNELLCVADRWPAKTREDVEARASFMLGDTYRMQADALEARSRDPKTGAASESDVVHAAETAKEAR